MLKKLFKKIGKFVKRGLKKVGSFFKRAFKGVGKFIGKLGPVGMLGMMLIMPQLGSWWSQFGEWAGTLAQPFKFGMKAIHEAGSLVGKAYSTITEGIDSIVGGFADTVGLGDQYKDFRSWMDTKMNEARDFVGLETTTPVTTPSVDDINMEEIAEIRPDYRTASASLDGPQIEADYFDKNTIENITVTGKKPESLLVADDFTGTAAVATLSKELTDIAKPDASKEWRSDDEIPFSEKLYDKGSKIYGAYEGTTKIMEKLGIGQEEHDPYYGAFVADNYVPMYESAQFDWTQQGYAGMPAYGIGNLNYLQSISNAFGTDPYYQWIAQQQQPRSA